MSYINSVTVYPSSATITKGQWFYEAYADILPYCPECGTVEWYSNNTSVATVNKSSGYIYAKGIGTTKIYAKATDGSGKKDYITVTVVAPVSVSGIEVSPSTKTMCVGCTDYIYSTVCPWNATNQTITWCSSDETVATIGTHTGFVRALKAGTTTITATTEDGGYVDSMILTVIIDNVRIVRDNDGYNKVIFEKSNKEWLCVNQDLIFSASDVHDTVPRRRANHNFFTIYNPSDLVNSDSTPKRYTDDEIKLLYAIDPYGVANYVKRYSETLNVGDDRSREVEEKDRIFRLLFNRNPYYFERTIDGFWYRTFEEKNLNIMLSESESYFGMRKIWDDFAIANMILAVVKTVKTVLNLVPSTSWLGRIIASVNTVDSVVKSGVLLMTGRFDTVLSDIASDMVDDAFESTSLSWLYEMVNTCTNIVSALEYLSDGYNFYKGILNYYSLDSGYNIYIKLKDNNYYKISDICSSIEEQ